MLNGYLFFDDESATLIEHPVIQVPAGTTELSTDQVREIFLSFFGDYSDEIITPEECADWSKEKIGQAMWDVHCLMMNKVALILPEHEEVITLMGDTLADQFGDDSSTYAACGTFAALLKALSVTIVDFPTSDSDLDYRDMK